MEQRWRRQNANAHLPDFFKSKGFEVHNLGLYANNADDFSAQIADLKKANCEILSGVFTPPEFGIFWTQCAQQDTGLRSLPRPRHLLFPAAVEALGDRGGIYPPKCGGRTIIRSSPG